jgi:hypothetical protein
MSDEHAAAAAATETPAEPAEAGPKPTETVDFWREKAREQEKRAKANADAARRLAEIEEASKSESEKVAERIAKAEAEAASVPAKVADALRGHLVALHGIDTDDAELFLTAADPDLLLKQAERLLARSDARKKPLHVPREGTSTTTTDSDERRAARELFGSG